MCNTDEMFMNIQMSKYKRNYFGVYTQLFSDTKDNEIITFSITHTPAGENQIFNITHVPAGENQTYGLYYRANLIANIRISCLSSRSGFLSLF